MCGDLLRARSGTPTQHSIFAVGRPKAATRGPKLRLKRNAERFTAAHQNGLSRQMLGPVDEIGQLGGRSRL